MSPRLNYAGFGSLDLGDQVTETRGKAARDKAREARKKKLRCAETAQRIKKRNSNRDVALCILDDGPLAGHIM